MKFYFHPIKFIKSYRFNKIRTITGTHLFDELNLNPFPFLLVSISSILVILWCSQFVYILSEFLERIISILEIQRILKLNFLENKDTYRYPSLFAYFYLSVSFIWDLSSYAYNQWFQRIVYTSDQIYWIRKHWIGYSVSKINRKDIQLTEVRLGSILQILGLVHFQFEFKGKVYLSPFLFYRSNKKFLSELIQS
jgi:uncharacterized protein YybS (DUF2232 family)